MTVLYDYCANNLAGAPVELAHYRGKVLLIVNTASRCGFTPQYQALEQIYRQYQAQGLVILGFPCNQFGRQEPGSASDIGTFCATHFKVSFPLFAKINVNGSHAHPLFTHLKSQARGVLGSKSIKWNFTKFLVGKDGSVYRRYSPCTAPTQLIGDIEKLLAQ
jgi:glutathione peroxidase